MNDFPRSEEAYKVALDLTVRKAVHSRGDVLVWLTWNRITSEPCMVLTRKDAHLGHERVIPCIIPLRRAWAWSEHLGDEADIAHTVGLFCVNMGFLDSPKNLRRILGVVRDYLGDLLLMPPMPTDTQVVAADALITDNATGKVKHMEIRDHA